MKSCHWLHFCFFPSKPSPNQKPSLLAVDSCHLSQEWLCLLSLMLAKVSFQLGRWGRVTIIYRVAAAQLLRCADIWFFADIISRSLQDLFFFNPHGHWCKVLSYWGVFYYYFRKRMNIFIRTTYFISFYKIAICYFLIQGCYSFKIILSIFLFKNLFEMIRVDVKY